ncbi:MAG: DUF1801 domain-containing protein [Bacteroidota bacterium]
MSPYPPHVSELAFSLRKFVLQQAPRASELIYDAYNAVSLAYSLSDSLKDAFCHIAVYPNHVNFGFNRGTELLQDMVVLEGTGKLIRHLKVTNDQKFPRNEVTLLLAETVEISIRRNPNLAKSNIQPASIVKSISQNKRRP